MIYKNNLYQIYFGDASDRLHLQFCLALREKLSGRPEFAQVFQHLQLEDLLFLHQVHGPHGYTITQESVQSMLAFAHDGDFLVTNQPHIGLATLTADCVPVICVDAKRKTAGIAHAGWKGAVAGVVDCMIDSMCDSWGSQIQDMQFFMGPSAKKCCYEVSPDFLVNLEKYSYRDQLINRIDTKIYFDVSELVYNQLLLRGAQFSAINRSYNLCTMCDNRFYSHRRGTLQGNAQAVGRQMTVVVLR